MRRIEWSLEARSNLDNIITYLENEWTEKEVRNFSERLEKQLSFLLQTPEVYKKSLRKVFGNVRSLITIHFFTPMTMRSYTSLQFLITDKIPRSWTRDCQGITCINLSKSLPRNTLTLPPRTSHRSFLASFGMPQGRSGVLARKLFRPRSTSHASSACTHNPRFGCCHALFRLGRFPFLRSSVITNSLHNLCLHGLWPPLSLAGG